MTDFKYDSYDESTLKVAFQNLRKAEGQGFWLGLLLGTPLGIYAVSNRGIRQKFTAGPLSKVVSSIAMGSLM